MPPCLASTHTHTHLTHTCSAGMHFLCIECCLSYRMSSFCIAFIERMDTPLYIENVLSTWHVLREWTHLSYTHLLRDFTFSQYILYRENTFFREYIPEREHLLYRTHLLRDTLSDDDDEGNLIFNGVNGRSHGEGWRHVDHRRVRLHCVCITYRSRTTDEHCLFITYHHGVFITYECCVCITYRSRTTYELCVFITYHHGVFITCEYCVCITYRSRSRTANESKTTCSISK
jgi:hypothetical protein